MEVCSRSKMHVVLDIHQVIACQEAEEALPLFQFYDSIAHYTYQGHRYRLYLYPGAKEFLSLLTRLQECTLSFFTSSQKEIAPTLVDALMVKSIGEESYARLRKNIQIADRSQLVYARKEQIEQQEKWGIKRADKYYKDLRALISPDSSLEETVLVDDIASFAPPEQQANLLHIYARRKWYKNVKRLNPAHPQGLERPSLTICFDHSDLATFATKVNAKRQLLVRWHRNAPPTICFRAKSGEVVEKRVSDEAMSALQSHISQTSNAAWFYSDQRDKWTPQLQKEVEELLKERELQLPARYVIRIYNATKKIKSCDEDDLLVQIQEDTIDVYPPLCCQKDEQEAIFLRVPNSMLPLFQAALSQWREQEVQRTKIKPIERGGKGELYEKLYAPIASEVAHKACGARANHLFLLAGALFQAQQEAQENSQPLSAIFRSWQFQKNEKGEERWDDERLYHWEELYLLGLTKLREINPQLDFVTPQTWQAAQERYPGPLQDQAEEHIECVIS